MEEESKEKTTQEIREEFLDHIRALVDFWDNTKRDTTKEQLSGLAFSIMNVLDGGTNLPAFIVAPCPHEDDKPYHIESGDDYYPENHETKVKGDIAGCLHEMFYKD